MIDPTSIFVTAVIACFGTYIASAIINGLSKKDLITKKELQETLRPLWKLARENEKKEKEIRDEVLSEVAEISLENSNERTAIAREYVSYKRLPSEVKAILTDIGDKRK